jgi:hypothetical protein
VQNSTKVRIEWVGLEDLPDVLRDCARAEIEALRDACQQMRAMTVETMGEVGCRATCICMGGRKRIRVTRETLGEVLEIFERVLRAQCPAPGAEAPH